MNVIDRIKKLGITCNAQTEQGVKHFYCGHEYVEIGGLKWATMNIGANSIIDNGLYFQWGDTQGYVASQVGSGKGKKQFSWEDYKLGNGDYSKVTKYNTLDGKVVLESCDDAVSCAWGNGWRMPTSDEFKALGNAVITSWVNDYQCSGVNGLVCIDKIDPSKVLFFPAAGYCNCVHHKGTNGVYWSSSRGNCVGYGFYFIFSKNSVGWSYDNDRYFGFSVRGVVD